MITFEAARKVVEEYLETTVSQQYPSRIVDEATQEHDFGWVFHYQSIKYLETGDFRFALAGNGPLIVDKEDGSLHVFGSANSPEHYAKQYHEDRAKRSAR